MWQVQLYTASGKFLKVSEVEVQTWAEVKAVVEQHYPGARLKDDGEELRFVSHRGRNVAYVDGSGDNCDW